MIHRKRRQQTAQDLDVLITLSVYYHPTSRSSGTYNKQLLVSLTVINLPSLKVLLTNYANQNGFYLVSALVSMVIGIIMSVPLWYNFNENRPRSTILRSENRILCCS